MGGGVYQPGDGAVDGVEALAGIEVGVVGAGEYLVEGGGLVGAGDEDEDATGGVDEGEGEGQAASC